MIHGIIANSDIHHRINEPERKMKFSINGLIVAVILIYCVSFEVEIHL